MRHGSEAMSTASAHGETSRKEGPLRILFVDPGTSCQLSIARAGDPDESIEVVRVTSAVNHQDWSDSWDLKITVVRDPRLGRAMARGARPGILGRLFRRERMTAFEREEHHATRTVVLSEIQREVGIALSAIEMGDFDTIGEIARRIRDDGATYDLAKLSGLGAALGDTVGSRDIRTARNIAQKLMTYMGKTIGSYAG